MKHGVVRTGNKVTYYGDDATRYFARMSAESTRDQEHALDKVRSSSGKFRTLLIEELELQGYKIPKELIKQLEEEDEKKETEARERAKAKHRADLKKKLKTKPLKTAKLTHVASCGLCGKKIERGQRYAGTHERSAHEECINLPDDDVPQS